MKLLPTPPTNSLLYKKVVRVELCDGQDGRPDDKRSRLWEILNDASLWKPGASRAVVFVTSRRLAEELAGFVNEEGKSGAGVASQKPLVAEPFHAGLPSEVRNRLYERFRDEGSEPHIDVLCATNAFGMGMDIDNIHLVVHFGPPDSLENYIQEIGRAARSERKLQAAGLSCATAVLLYTDADFEKMHGRLRRDMLSQMDLQVLLSAIDAEFDPAPQLPALVAMPLGNLARRSPGLNGNKLRVGLYWLEKMGRIKVGCFAPAQLTLIIDNKRLKTTGHPLSSEAQSILGQLDIDKTLDKARVAVSLAALRGQPGLKSNRDIFKHLAEMEKDGIVSGPKLFLPLSRDSERVQECFACVEGETWPLLNAAMRAIVNLPTLMRGSGRDGNYELSLQKLAEFLGRTPNTLNTLNATEYDWINPEVKRARRIQSDMNVLTKQGHVLLRLVENLGIFTVTEHIETNDLSLSIRPRRNDWETRLQAVPHLVKRALKFIVEAQLPAKPETASERRTAIPPWAIRYQPDPIRDADEPGDIDGLKLIRCVKEASKFPIGQREMEAILRFLRDLGYIERTDSYTPLAYDITLLDRSDLNTAHSEVDDQAVLKEMTEQAELRIWRLYALEAIPCIAETPTDLEVFIEDYFSNDPLNPASKALNPASKALDNQYARRPHAKLDKILRKARAEAFQAFLETGGKDPPLSPEQRQVFYAPADRDIMINAGPGAGKTKTLLARLVYLIHERRELPERILVLAFTRAVVDELRSRLRQIFKDLGYGALVEHMDIHTFHSFALSELRRNHQADTPEHDKRDFDQPIQELVNLLGKNRKLQSELVGKYHYIFVDEFQDVSKVRYKLVKLLAGVDSSGKRPSRKAFPYFVVALDDDQAIFDEQAGDDDQSANGVLKHFRGWTDLVEYHLTTNYRSAHPIVEESQNLILSQIQNRMKAVRLQAFDKQREGSFERVELDDTQTDPVAEVIAQVEKLRDRLSKQNGNADKTIAILTRTNADVYRIKRSLQDTFGTEFTLLVQGAESRFYQRRDVARMVDLLESAEVAKRKASSLERWLHARLQEPQFAYWQEQAQHPERNELWHLGQSFLEQAGPGATFGDFAEYLYEVSQNGNYLQKVAKQQARDSTSSGRIVLSTIHKVKGLEFPAVILPSSNMGHSNKEQELRVIYVGMTRAAKALVFICGPREKSLLAGKDYTGQEHSQNGITVSPNLSDVYISYFGQRDIRVKIIDNLMVGQQLALHRDGDKFSIRLPETNHYFGMLARQSQLAQTASRLFPECRAFSGLEVAGIYRRSVEMDKKPKPDDGTLWYDGLCSLAIDRGYYHVVEVCGYVQPTIA